MGAQEGMSLYQMVTNFINHPALNQVHEFLQPMGAQEGMSLYQMVSNFINHPALHQVHEFLIIHSG